MRVSGLLVFIILGLLATGGCKSMTPGQLDRVQPTSDSPYVGNVYLLRGFIGIWSYGVDHLGEKINAAGIRASVYQDDQWQQLTDAIIAQYAKSPDHEPLILIGHSYGADDAIRVARHLQEQKIDVDLLITLDPVTPPDVPANVRLCYNIYQPSMLDGLPFFRGVKLDSEVPGGANLQNVNIRAERRDLLESDTDHFNIEKNTKIHAEVVRKLLEFCPPRQVWLAQRQPMRYSSAGKNAAADPPPAGAAVPPAAARRVGATDPRLERVP